MVVFETTLYINFWDLKNYHRLLGYHRHLLTQFLAVCTRVLFKTVQNVDATPAVSDNAMISENCWVLDAKS